MLMVYALIIKYFLDYPYPLALELANHCDQYERPKPLIHPDVVLAVARSVLLLLSLLLLLMMIDVLA
jgi:hypothetical protein